MHKFNIAMKFEEAIQKIQYGKGFIYLITQRIYRVIFTV